MPSITRDQVRVPADVPADARDIYIENYLKATRGTGRLMLFACDQKIEHLNDDFFGEGIAAEDSEPEHLFRIGSQGVCGVLAGQRGLIAQYAADYPDVNYLVKINSKTHLVKTSQDPAKHQDDPYSPQLYDIETVLDLRDNGVNVVGIGYTIYLGSEYESTMMAEAGQLIADAHSQGLIVVLWMYPRGKAVANEKDAHLIAGAAGTALCLGRRLREGQPAQGRRRGLLGRQAQGGGIGVGPHRSRVRRRLDGRGRDVSSSSCGTRSTWAARSATRPGATSTSARSTRRFVSRRRSAPSRWATGASTTPKPCSTARRTSGSRPKPVAMS